MAEIQRSIQRTREAITESEEDIKRLERERAQILEQGGAEAGGVGKEELGKLLVACKAMPTSVQAVPTLQEAATAFGNVLEEVLGQLRRRRRQTSRPRQSRCSSTRQPLWRGRRRASWRTLVSSWRARHCRRPRRPLRALRSGSTTRLARRASPGGWGSPGLALMSANSTTWQRPRDFAETNSRFVVLGQEMHVKDEELAEAQVWAKFHHWKGVWAEAQAGPGEGTTGGVVVFSPSHMSLAAPQGCNEVLVPGRAVAAHLAAGPQAGSCWCRCTCTMASSGARGTCWP